MTECSRTDVMGFEVGDCTRLKNSTDGSESYVHPISDEKIRFLGGRMRRYANCLGIERKYIKDVNHV